MRSNGKFIQQFRKHMSVGEYNNEDLRQFGLLLKKRKQDIIKEYFEQGGTAGDMIKFIKHSPSHIDITIKILEQMFLRSKLEFPLTQPECEVAAIKLLKTSNTVLMNLLITGDKNSKLCLKMLTAMVSLSPKIGRQVIKLIELKKVLKACSLKNKRLSLRESVIYFILSFCIDQDTGLIQLFLSNHYLEIGSLLIELKNDEVKLIQITLKTLEEKILKTVGISKFNKQKLFNSRLLENLISLYDWDGKELQSKVTSEDIEALRATVHSFFLTLFTSKKYGIVYSGPSNSDRCQNLHIFNAIKCIKQPWECKLRQELILNILKIAPDLMKPMLSLYVKINFIPTPTLTWIHAMDFLIQLLKSTKLPDSSVNITELSTMISNISIPIILHKVIIIPGIEHDNLMIRNKTIELIATMIKCITSHVQYVNHKKLIAPIQLQNLKHSLSTTLIKILPNANILLSVWNDIINLDEDNQEVTDVPSKSLQLDVFFSLLLGYQQWLPHWIPKKFKKDINRIKINLFSSEHNSDLNQRIVLKAAYFLVEFDLYSLNFIEDKWIISTLLSNYQTEELSKKYLHIILNNFNIIKENDYELELWLDALENESDVKLLSEAIVYAITNTNTSNYTNHNSSELLENLLSGLDGDDVEKKSKSRNSFSCLMSAVLTVATDQNKCKIFINRVFLRNLFHQMNPNIYLKSMSKHKKYIRSSLCWVNEPIVEITEIIQTFLSCEEVSLIQYLLGDKNQIKWMKAEEKLIYHYFILTFFLVNQGNFSTEMVEKASYVINTLLEKATSETKRRCLSYLYLHPSLQKFSFYDENLVKILLILIPHSHSINYQDFIILLKQKVVENISDHKSESLDIVDILCKLQLNYEETVDIFNIINQLNISEQLNNYERIINFTIERLMQLKDAKPLSSDQIKFLLDKLIQVNKNEETQLIKLEKTLIKYFKAFEFNKAEISKHCKGLIKKILKRNEKCTILLEILLFISTKEDIEKLYGKKYLKENQMSLSVLSILLIKQIDQELISHNINFSWETIQNDLENSLYNPKDMMSPIIKENLEAVMFLSTKCSDEKYSKKIIKKLLRKNICGENSLHLKLVDSCTSKIYELYLPWLIKSIIHTYNNNNNNNLLPDLYLQLNKVFIAKDEELRNYCSEDTWLEFINCSLHQTIVKETFLFKLLRNVISSLNNSKINISTWNLLTSKFAAKKSDITTDELKIMYRLLSIEKSILRLKDIPLLLAAYDASLSQRDQIIFKMLRLYEIEGGSYEQYLPLIWGEAAMRHYAGFKTETSLWTQSSLNQVLQLFDQKRIETTISRYPVNRTMDTNEPFDNEVYDPAFTCIIMTQILSNENKVDVWLFCRNIFGLIIMGLCSQSKQVRNTTKTVIYRLHSHLTSLRSSTENKKWINFIETIVRTMQKSEVDVLPTIICVFLARTAFIISHPEHKLYKLLNQYILIRPFVDIQLIPEFLRLLQSTDAEQRFHQEWILDVVRDGLRNNSDLKIFNSSFAFKLLSSIFDSRFSTTSYSLKFISIIKNLMEIEGNVEKLISINGLFSWISGALLLYTKDQDTIRNELMKLIQSTPPYILRIKYTNMDIRRINLLYLNDLLYFLRNSQFNPEVFDAKFELINIPNDHHTHVEIIKSLQMGRYFDIAMH